MEREPRDPAVAGGAEPRADELHSALTSDGWSALQIEVPLANVRVEDQRHLARVLAMEVAGRLHQLTAAELAPAVQNALRDDQAWPLTWEFEALDWTGNPATVGLFRLAGIARTSGGGEVPWTVVLKVAADVDLTGDPLVDRYTHEPEGSNYWKREALAFSSGLLIGWPGPLVPVHCYGVEEVSKSQAWIWWRPGKTRARMPYGQLNSLLQRPTTSAR